MCVHAYDLLKSILVAIAELCEELRAPERRVTEQILIISLILIIASSSSVTYI